MVGVLFVEGGDEFVVVYGYGFFIFDLLDLFVVVVYCGVVW